MSKLAPPNPKLPNYKPLKRKAVIDYFEEMIGITKSHLELIKQEEEESEERQDLPEDVHDS
jgi:hypothetical protein